MKQQKYLLVLCLSLLFTLSACQKTQQVPLPVGELRLGVAPFTQPRDNHEMIAGYFLKNAKKVSHEQLNELDTMLANVLAQSSKNTYLGYSIAEGCYNKILQDRDIKTQGAIATWSSVGNCMGVDVLLIPQVHYMQAREGSPAGVVRPAGISLDFYLLDVRNKTLISRTRFDEIQKPLSENLLEIDKFIKRGAKWVSAQELAREAMQEAIKELGL